MVPRIANSRTKTAAAVAPIARYIKALSSANETALTVGDDLIEGADAVPGAKGDPTRTGPIASAAVLIETAGDVAPSGSDWGLFSDSAGDGSVSAAGAGSGVEITFATNSASDGAGAKGSFAAA